jgi:hypothetical protein
MRTGRGNRSSRRKLASVPLFNFFLIRIFVGGVQLDTLVTSVTNWPIVPSAGDYDDRKNLVE